MKVFYSWQSDVHPKACRKFIKAALTDALKKAGEALDLEEADRPVVDEATTGAAGMVDIAGTLLEKIAASAAYVADITPIAKSPRGRALPNPNVVYELGWACAKPGYQHVIALMNTADGYRVEDLPFDIRNRRVVTYELKDDATPAQIAKEQKALAGILASALTTNLSARIRETSSTVLITGQAAHPDDFSVWNHEGHFTVQNFRGQNHEIYIPTEPRAFLRIIPVGWNKSIPTPDDIENMKGEHALWPPIMNSGGADSNHCGEGYARYVFTGEMGSSIAGSVVMYFDDNGEFWMIFGNAYWDAPAGRAVALGAVVSGWKRFLAKANIALDALGAKRLRRVELGMTELKNVKFWRTTNKSVQSLKPYVRHDDQKPEWSPEVQQVFLMQALAKVHAAFAMPPPTDADLQRYLANPA